MVVQSTVVGCAWFIATQDFHSSVIRFTAQMNTAENVLPH
jgi:hypothetical protein